MGWAAGPGVGDAKAFELRGAGEGIERLEGTEARGLPSARHLFRHPVGVEATQVSGNGTKVLSLVCGFGIQSFVPYIWDIPDVCSNALVLKVQQRLNFLVLMISVEALLLLI